MIVVIILVEFTFIRQLAKDCLKHVGIPRPSTFSLHPVMRCSFNSHCGHRGFFPLLALRYGARFPHGAFSRVCGQTRLFRNEPRLRSVVNPSHRWLAPREPGWSFAVTRISPLSLFIHKEKPDAVPTDRRGALDKRRSGV